VSVEFDDFNASMGRWFGNKAYPTADGGMSVYFEDITAHRLAEDALREAQEAQALELADARLLQDTSTSLIREGDVGTLYAKIVDAAVVVMRSDFGSLQALDAQRAELRLLASNSLPPAAAAAWERVSASDGCSWARALSTMTRVIVPDVEEADVIAGSRDLATYREAGVRAAQYTPLVSRSGKPLGMISTHWRSLHEPSERDLRLLDVLARQAADLMERTQAVEALRESDRRKDEFLATLSHELRNPLNAIVGWTHLLRDSLPGDETFRKAVEIIYRNALAQSQLIADMLDVSSIIAGKMRLAVSSVDLHRVIHSAVDTVRPAADARGVRLDLELDPMTVHVAGDSERLQQVVWNLLSNAIKFAPEKQGRVQVRLQAVGSHLRITVEDNGPGIGTDFLPYVFDRFSQADTSNARRHRGLGLGLAIVRHLVELHGGTVKAENREERGGARFVIDLPRLSLATQPASPTAERHPSAEPEFVWLDRAPSLKGIRVLVVDDERDTRHLIKAVLERCGAQVTACGSARDGLLALISERPDVLLADVEMPEQNGYELIREVRALPAGEGGRTPAAALTAYAATQDRMKALNAGFQIHLPKPVQPAELATVVASLSRRGGLTEGAVLDETR
jgi:signal transduction histidine kinase/CheY-like chemotaxis protein